MLSSCKQLLMHTFPLPQHISNVFSAEDTDPLFTH
jgi:hypothetical protein